MSGTPGLRSSPLGVRALRLGKAGEEFTGGGHHLQPGASLSPLLLRRGNLLPNLTAADIKTCRFHPDKAPFCPILRVGDVVKFAGQDFAKLASTVRTQSRFHDPSEGPSPAPDFAALGRAAGMPGTGTRRRRSATWREHPRPAPASGLVPFYPPPC